MCLLISLSVYFFFNNFARNTNLARRGYFTLRTENEKKRTVDRELFFQKISRNRVEKTFAPIYFIVRGCVGFLPLSVSPEFYTGTVNGR